MDLARARYLVSARGREALAALPPGLEDLDPVRLATALRRTHPPVEASALAEQVTLRAKAETRFGDHGGILFTPAGLEMMTHPLVASRRAARLATLGLPVADLTCGLGGDLRAAAEAGIPAVGIDRDAATALLAAANVPRARAVRGDAAAPPVNLHRFAVVLDPSRRSGAGRRFDPAAFSPQWDVALGLAGKGQAGVIKAPPGLDHRHVPPGAEVEYVQLGRSMREAAVWVGAGAIAGLRRAVLPPGSATLESSEPEALATLVPPGEFVFDPESCVTLAGVVRHLAHRLGAQMMDERVAYLTSDVPVFNELCTTFRVLEMLPFSIARLKVRLKERGWAPSEVRRRAFPVEPDELRRLLGALEGEPVTLLCTTLAGKRTVLVAQRLYPGDEDNCARG